MLFVAPKPTGLTSRKIISAAIFLILMLGGAAYGVTYFISAQQEKARLEAEKKQFADFDTLNFKTDADSVANAMKSLPAQFNVQPPYTDLIKRNVDEFESTRQKSEKDSYTTISSPWTGKGNSIPGYSTTSYSVIELQPLQFDYVKGAGNKLVCFVLYQARLEVFNTGVSMFPQPLNPVTKQPLNNNKDRGKKVGEREVKETARYDFENGGWVFKSAGITDVSRFTEIDKVRIEAKTKQ
jgi:hypothetical protein